VGLPNTWIGWAAVDQAIRLLAGEAPVDDEQIPVRTFTPSNAASLDLEDPSSWYASFDFRDFYRELWSVG
jgi:ABC-type sugar transport system substrate-binding protein